jgi:two-component system nitrate/nitrite response regulator NarL
LSDSPRTIGRIRVLIVDDHVAVAESLQALLSRHADLELTELATNADHALRIVRESAPHVVLMDQGLPGMSGAEATAHVLAERPETAVVMFSGGMSDDDLVTAVESGIRGYVMKGARSAEVVSAVRRAAAGEILLPPEELARLLRRGRERARERKERDRHLDALTPREKEVLRLMAKAEDVEKIAEGLKISPSTARGYIQNILEKLQAHSKLEAVVRANALGLLEA